MFTSGINRRCAKALFRKTLPLFSQRKISVLSANQCKKEVFNKGVGQRSFFSLSSLWTFTRTDLTSTKLIEKTGQGVTDCKRLHTSRRLSKSENSLHDQPSHAEEDEDIKQLDSERKKIWEEHYLLPSSGHHIIVIQPEFRAPNKRPVLTTSELQLAEACALVDSLNWGIVDKKIQRIKRDSSKIIFSKGILQELTAWVRQSKNVTAVFVSINTLSTTQLGNLQRLWKMPVYDRYTIVLQIFMLRARTKEARLQVALAEIPYLRARLVGMHDGTLDQQGGGLASVGGSGETFLQLRQRLLQQREIKLKRKIAMIKEKRDMLRKERMKRELPVVAIVGYTNAGKTSLIKALTGEKDMTPRNQLFATLDVTAHSGLLPNRMKVLYMDTVGFISDIPTSLIQSFAATLEDVRAADVIVHVQDVSHPDRVAQTQNVHQTLASLQLPEELSNSIINVGNKRDLLESAPDDDDCVYVSATTGLGLQTFGQVLAETIISNTGRVCKKLKLPMNGPYLRWLYKEATITNSRADERDPEFLLVDTVMTAAVYGKFVATFGRGKKRKT